MSKKQMPSGKRAYLPPESTLRTALEFYITGEHGLAHPERTNGAAPGYVRAVARIIAANRSRFPTMIEEFEQELNDVLATYGETGPELRREYERGLRGASTS